MNTLINILFLGVCVHSVYCGYYHGPTAKPVVLHNGYLADTHEVAAAKNAHLTALAEGSHYGGKFVEDNYFDNEHSDGYEHRGSYDSHHGDFRNHGNTVIPHVFHHGNKEGTHELTKAKSHGGDHHNGRYAAGYYADHGHSQHIAPYHRPLFKPVVLKSGYLADTHEVASAKAEHLSAVAKAKSHGIYGDHSHHSAPYHGPLFKPVVLKSGYLADTHEVASAKAEHLSAVAKAKSHGIYGDHYNDLRYASGYYAEQGHSHHVAPYHGPLFKPAVLKSGYLVDTHDVTAAKQHLLEALHAASTQGNYGYH